MLKVNLFDTNFAHSVSVDGFDSASRRLPKKIEYVRNLLEFDGITLFTDNMIFSPEVDKVKCNTKIAWCLESPSIEPNVHANIKSIEHKFDYIVTCNLDFVIANPAKYKYCSVACCWIKDKEIQLYEKSKLVSHIITSKYSTEGHKLRHHIANLVRGVDIYGRSRFTKLEPHKDYMFSIIIENGKHNGYFSEKIIDCLCQGCIPIYWGDPNISQHFNMKGILTFNTIEDLKSLQINSKYYYDNIEAVHQNLEICKSNFLCCDDTLADVLEKECV